MEKLLRKYLWALDGLVVAAIAIVAAQAASIGVGASLLAQFSSFQRPHAALARPPEAVLYAKDANLIVQRNIFCSSCRPVDASTDAEAAPAGPQKTTLPLKLMAIMYDPAPNGARWTTAVVRDTELAAAGPYRVGDAVHGARIIDIGATRLTLDNAGRIEFLDLIDGSATPAPPPAAPAPAVALQEPPRPTPSPAAPPRTPVSTELFQVRGDRIKRHPH